jgi:hypothetical protein
VGVHSLSGGHASFRPVRQEPLDRAYQRIDQAGQRADPVALDAAIDRAREALATLAERTAELEAAVPERVGAAVQEGLRAEVLPVGRHIAEVRGLSGQTIRRLEQVQASLDAESRARVEDLAVLVDLVATGWRSLERRLDRLERAIDRIDRSLEDRPVAELYRLEDRQERRSG